MTRKLLALAIFLLPQLGMTTIYCGEKLDYVCIASPQNDSQCSEGKAYRCEEFKNICSSYQMSQDEFTFKNYFPAKKRINRTDFPRNYRLLYRGIKNVSTQFTLQKFIAAVFGDKTPSIGTAMGFHIENDLMHTSGHINHIKNLNDIDKYLEVGQVKTEFQNLKNCLKDKKISKRMAHFYAQDLVNKAFLNIEDDNDIDDYFFDYVSSRFRDYGQWGQFQIYSTLHPMIAHNYAGKILVHSDKNKAIDLNFWNARNGNHWSGSPADVGEFATPAYIQPETVEAIWFTRGTSRHRSSPYINVAYQKVSFKGQTYILVVDGQDHSCIKLDSNQRPKSCKVSYNFDSPSGKVNNPNHVVFGDTSITKNELPLMGIITQCEYNHECDIDPAIFNHYDYKSSKKMGNSWKRKVEETYFINNSKLYKTKFHYLP
jgi:hypothetical protein